ncbi:methyl-accepting chemotaxis protein [Sedimentibacter acidaminivorans]|uniref:Methyl-accepting chemotaxis protein n=1 Tax=Sedimentibacter acidaminivorans TaxID=913099 RepID=A0ABS4GDE6_9FIRM|nr:methyl-accepting chemotaxis protein [Sedimentibacter acidaminivorans]MBP1925699.1 methyl-accepting chemotaxis protein [Sedimentibacter acidaminivorans]
MKSIKTKLFASIVAIVVIAQIVVGGVSAFLNYKSTFDTLEKTMSDVAIIGSNSVRNKLEVYETIASNIGLNAKLTNLFTTQSQKIEIYKQMINKYNLIDVYVTNRNGSAVSNSTGKINIVRDTDYFKASMNGDTFIANPEISETGQINCIISAPLWKDGIYDSFVEGVVVIEVDGLVLSDISSSVKVGTDGYGFILDKDGNIIAHMNKDKVLNKENPIANYENDGSNKKLALLLQKMLKGEATFGTYTYEGASKLLTYSPIEGTDGWGFFESTPQNEYLENMFFSLIVTCVIVALSIVFASILAILLANRISNPIKSCAERLELLSNGDLHTEVPKTTSKDETSLLLNSLELTVSRLNTIISDITYHLGKISEGDFTTTVENEYEGDLSEINVSIKKIIKFLNDITGQIDESAGQVASGSEQIAGGAQALSQGATEQASSIEELAATINEMTEHINQSAQNSENAKKVSDESSIEVRNGSNQIKTMMHAMDEINETSLKIGKIIKAIEDIAFQTNILALNAAVEAARAGSAGKGFAVVADEVRNLASKSADAANETTQLIESSLNAVSNGVKIAGDTEGSLKLIVEKTNMTASLIDEIAQTSKQQAMAANQVTAGIEQISAVVQTNSATAEESAAASEELNGQAQVLRNLVDGIKLKNKAYND